MSSDTAEKRTRRPRRKPAEARALLIEAAQSELLENGGGFELARVTNRAGVSPGLPHHYFGSKSRLLAAVVDEYIERLEAEVARVKGDAQITWRERERRRVENYMRFIANDPLSPYVMGSLAGKPEVLEIVAASLDRIIAEGARNFGQGQAMGEVKKDLPPEVLSAAVHGAIRQVTLQALRSSKPIDQSELTEQVWALVETWLTP